MSSLLSTVKQWIICGANSHSEYQPTNNTENVTLGEPDDVPVTVGGPARRA